MLCYIEMNRRSTEMFITQGFGFDGLSHWQIWGGDYSD